MLKTAAWRSLSANARAIYVEMASRFGGPGSNNGRIPYSVRDAAKSLKIGKSTAARAIETLQDRGFIVEVTKGAFSLKVKHATEWRCRLCSLVAATEADTPRAVRARLLMLTQLVERVEARTDLLGVLGFRVDVTVLKVANQRGIFGH
jgi:DNA-binding transcriptional MocR family regulator